MPLHDLDATSIYPFTMLAAVAAASMLGCTLREEITCITFVMTQMDYV